MKPPVDRATVPTLTEENVVLRSPRFTLRLVRPDDADAMHAHAKDPELSRMMVWAAHQTVDETRAVIAGQRASLEKQTDVVWCIEVDGELGGLVGLHGIKWNVLATRRDHAIIGYWIAPVYQRRGIMTEAVKLVLRFAFETLGLHKVGVTCFGGNDASRRVIEKCGFRFIGTLREDVWRDGVWHDHLQYEMTASEWGG